MTNEFVNHMTKCLTLCASKVNEKEFLQILHTFKQG